MYRAYKYRIYLDYEQEMVLKKIFGCIRFIYNYYLKIMIEDKKQNSMKCIKDYQYNLKLKNPFLKETDDAAVRKTIFSLEDKIKQSKKAGLNAPKYKSKFNKESYTVSAMYQDYYKSFNIILDLNERKIKLPKMGWVNCRGYRNKKLIEGKLVNATISKEANGKYYVSLLYNVPDAKLIKNPNSIIGIDLGIKKLLTLSDGTVYENNRYINKYENKIKKLQKDLIRKQKNSKNYYKCKKELSNVFSKLKNARKFYIHEITKQITDNYDIIVCEDLKVKEMMILNKDKFSKSIADATFSEIINQLEYKAKMKGKCFYKINSYYPSSQICSTCDYINKKYKDLDKRQYICEKCGSIIDRDYNASVNIMFEGLKLHMKDIKQKL